jgi:hypothetical protein
VLPRLGSTRLWWFASRPSTACYSNGLGFFPGFRLPPPPPRHSTMDDSPTLALLLTSATLPLTQLHDPGPSSTHPRLISPTHRPTPHLASSHRSATPSHCDRSHRRYYPATIDASNAPVLSKCIRSTQPPTVLRTWSVLLSTQLLGLCYRSTQSTAYRATWSVLSVPLYPLY